MRSFAQVWTNGWAHNLPTGRGVLLPGAHHWKLAMAEHYSDPKEHSTVARWHPTFGVEVLQTPDAAWKVYRAYEQEPRYA
jgi:hypothetical protein